MKTRPIIMIAIAVIFGALSIFVADIWLNTEGNARPIVVKETIRETPGPSFETIVVASKPMRYGDKVEAANLVEIPWPEDKLPAGAYKNIKQAINDGARVVLTPIEMNEPLLLSKLSGENGRATLSNTLSSGMRAVTIPVDDVSGVAGFITPGDRVDIVLIRSSETMDADLILENVKVVTVDQAADERSTDAKIANAVTVEVTSEDARKLALAKATGKLTLTLRAAGDQAIAAKSDDSETTSIISTLTNFDEEPRTRTVIVTRALAPTPYSVVNEEYINKRRVKVAGQASPAQ